MKNLLLVFKPRIFLLFVFIELFSFSAEANPGDTTWVTIYSNRKITQYGTYDTVSVFPTGLRYRKIRMHYILGRYACPAGSQYCGSWDYTTQIYARPAGKDSVEIARVITPYAGAWTLNQTHDYVLDVTDYASALEGTTAMRFNYEGYSWGFTITLKLEMIEGIPPMDALSVKNIYDGYYLYGSSTPSASIESYLVPKALTYTVATSRPFIKNTVSGHGYDSQTTQCAEFCSKYYQLNINSNLISQNQLWRTDCGANEVYPQAGTWIYQRANWCPGAVVIPIYHDISTFVNANSTFTVDVDMQPYTSPGQGSLGGFNWVSQLIDYSAPNRANDISIEDIVAPTQDQNYARSNPTCSNPILRIRNTGSQTVTSIVFNYGLAGAAPSSFTWTGTLNFLDQADVTINPPSPIFTNTTATTFTAGIVSVNGAPADDNLFNNIYSSVAPAVTILPSSFVIKIMTNVFEQFNETAWTLYDAYDNIMASRSNMSSTTVYRDTVTLADGCYRFNVVDLDCDGMNNTTNQSAGNGTLGFIKLSPASTLVSFSNDFGCGFDKFFKVMTPQTDVGIATYTRDNDIDLFPNPANSSAFMKLDLNKSQNISYKITDVNGRVVQQKSLGKITAVYETVDLSSFANGFYMITIQLEEGTVTKKLLVQK